MDQLFSKTEREEAVELGQVVEGMHFYRGNGQVQGRPKPTWGLQQNFNLCYFILLKV